MKCCICGKIYRAGKDFSGSKSKTHGICESCWPEYISLTCEVSALKDTIKELKRSISSTGSRGLKALWNSKIEQLESKLALKQKMLNVILNKEDGGNIKR